VRTGLAKPDLSRAATVVAASDQVLFVSPPHATRCTSNRATARSSTSSAPWNAKGATTEVKLPLEGAASLMSATPARTEPSWALRRGPVRRRFFAVDAAGKAQHQAAAGWANYDAPEGLVATEVKVKSHDGTLVPLSIIHRSDVKLDGSNPTLLYGYGAYGITEEPSFRARGPPGSSEAACLRWRTFAAAASMAGMVQGRLQDDQAEHLEGPDRCAEYLIAQKYTSTAKLGILGRQRRRHSRRPRAITERPTCLPSAVPAVGVLDVGSRRDDRQRIPNIPSSAR
jgi:prolyl oligopeptidase